jgi:hypothetical protein
MRFGLEIQVSQKEGSISLAELAKNLEVAKTVLASPEQVEGALVPLVNDKAVLAPHVDPLFPLLEQWMLKLPWLLTGDTETVFLRNSEYTFGFEPVGDLLHLSFYVGAKNEVEEYVLEPVSVPLEVFCEISIQSSRLLLGIADKLGSLKDQADVRTLRDATAEAEKALKNHRLER